MQVVAAAAAITQQVALVDWAAAAQEVRRRQVIKPLVPRILVVAGVQMGMRAMERRGPEVRVS